MDEYKLTIKNSKDPLMVELCKLREKIKHTNM